MALFYYLIATIIIFCLLYLRAKVVFSARRDWNYFVYRYHSYCRMHYTEQEKPQCRIQENELTVAEGVMVFLMFWKIDAQYFFDFKPDWADIHEIYILRNG